MANFVQIPPLVGTNELKQWVSQSLSDGRRMFKLILYNPNDYEDDKDPVLKAIINGQQFPIQADTCKIVMNVSTLALAFDARMILLACVGKKKIDSLNENRQQLLDVCQKIEDVIGKTPVVEEMSEAVADYQTAVDNLLNFSKNE